MAQKGQKFNKFSPEYRLEVINEFFETGLTVTELATKHNINKNTINSWLRNYGKGKLNTKRGRLSKQDENSMEYWKNKCELMEKYMRETPLLYEQKSILLNKIKEIDQLNDYAKASIYQKELTEDIDANVEKKWLDSKKTNNLKH